MIRKVRLIQLLGLDCAMVHPPRQHVLPSISSAIRHVQKAVAKQNLQSQLIDCVDRNRRKRQLNDGGLHRREATLGRIVVQNLEPQTVKTPSVETIGNNKIIKTL